MDTFTRILCGKYWKAIISSNQYTLFKLKSPYHEIHGPKVLDFLWQSWEKVTWGIYAQIENLRVAQPGALTARISVLFPSTLWQKKIQLQKHLLLFIFVIQMNKIKKWLLEITMHHYQKPSDSINIKRVLREAHCELSLFTMNIQTL
jgi:hypothetical protein